MKKRDISILLGKKFGRLTVISEAEPFVSHSRNYRAVLCRCDCGINKPFRLNDISSGHAKSCGCLLKDRIKEAITTHGDTRDNKLSSEYRSWIAMKARCLNRNSLKYPKYGGKGIKVCDRWIESYSDFLKDMGRKPTPKHTIDRWPNRNGHYEPGNCRWATPIQQRENQDIQPRGMTVCFRGEAKTLIEWARKFSIPSTTIYYRIKRDWPIEKALTTPVRPRKNLHKQIW